MFIKRDECKSIKEVVERNTGLSAEEFLKEEKLLYIHNLDKAAVFIVNFIEQNPNKPITVFGDYDCDGICATAILYWMFKTMKIEPVLRLPKRISEGYGLNSTIIDEISEGLLITVDNGISASQAIEKAKLKGLSVIILDHHLAPIDVIGNSKLPPADIIVDPAIENESVFHNYCGAALAYRLAKEIFPRTNLAPLEMLAGLATVADVVPLISENRTLVKNSLKYFNEGTACNLVTGIIELKKHLYEDDPGVLDENEYSFKLAPCLNAPGRLRDDGASLPLRLLTVGTAGDNLPILANEIIKLNDYRKKKKEEGMKLIQPLLDGKRPIVVFHRELHEGIVGLIASSLMEEYKCPAIVFTESEKPGIIKGSGRSIAGIHLKNILDQLNVKGLIETHGGHEKAAGVSIRKENLEAFKAAFCNSVEALPSLANEFYDLDLYLERLPDYFAELKQYAPFGEGNKEPVFRLIHDFSRFRIRSVGEKGLHLSMWSPKLKLIGFNCYEKWKEMGCPRKMSVIGTLGKSYWKGQETVQVNVIDILSGS